MEAIELENGESCERFPIGATVIPGGSEGRASFGFKYGGWRLVLTEDLLRALKTGEQLAVDVNDEYVVFIEAAPELVTKAAIDELPETEMNPEKYKRYGSAGELITEIIENTPS